MTPCTRCDEPEILAREGAQLGRDYAERRRTVPGFRFQWPRRAGVCTWTNLFFTCTACNHAKGEQWDEALLRPDDPGFSFERYFEYRFDSGQLHPARAATPDEQLRARTTIDILCLNRAGACTSRKRAVRYIMRATTQDDFADEAYRYLIPLCREVRELGLEQGS